MFETEQAVDPASLPSPAGSGPRFRVTAMDGFFAANMLLIAVMAAAVYFPRWLSLRGPGVASVAMFLFYAALLFSAGGLLWAWLRRNPLPLRMLVVVEACALAHFAGGLVHFGGRRLYSHAFFGIRYDKYVHVACSLFAALVVQEISRLRRGEHAGRWRAVLVALAAGVAWEASAGVLVLSVPGGGGWSLADTLRDLAANVCGVIMFLSLSPPGKLSPR